MPSLNKPTEKEILEEPAGEKIEKWVAEIALKQRPCNNWDFFSMGSAGGWGYKQEPPLCVHECYPKKMGPPHYSREISATIELIDKFRKEGKEWQIKTGNPVLVSNYSDEHVPLEGWGWGDKHIYVEDTTIELAFCKATLLLEINE